MDSLIQTVKDNNLKLTLSFGIALHHAGLHERDRKIAEELFVNQKIQVSERIDYGERLFILIAGASNCCAGLRGYKPQTSQTIWVFKQLRRMCCLNVRKQGKLFSANAAWYD